MSHTDSFNERYFSSLLKTMYQRGIQLRTPRKPYSEHRQIVDSWPKNIDTAAKILKSKNEISVDLTLKGDEAAAQFSRLKQNANYFNDIIGGKVDWKDELPKERQIVAVLAADPMDETDWPRQHAWLAAKLIAFRIAFELAIETRDPKTNAEGQRFPRKSGRG
jgi:hypothetical protein